MRRDRIFILVAIFILVLLVNFLYGEYQRESQNKKNEKSIPIAVQNEKLQERFDQSLKNDTIDELKIYLNEWELFELLRDNIGMDRNRIVVDWEKQHCAFVGRGEQNDLSISVNYTDENYALCDYTSPQLPDSMGSLLEEYKRIIVSALLEASKEFQKATIIDITDRSFVLDDQQTMVYFDISKIDDKLGLDYILRDIGFKLSRRGYDYYLSIKPGMNFETRYYREFENGYCEQIRISENLLQYRIGNFCSNEGKRFNENLNYLNVKVNQDKMIDLIDYLYTENEKLKQNRVTINSLDDYILNQDFSILVEGDDILYLWSKSLIKKDIHISNQLEEYRFISEDYGSTARGVYMRNNEDDTCTIITLSARGMMMYNSNKCDTLID